MNRSCIWGRNYLGIPKANLLVHFRIFSILITAIISTVAFGQTKGPASVGEVVSMLDMPSIAPLFIENAAFHTSLYIVNAGDAPVTGKLILRGLDGQVIVDTAIPLNAHSSQQVNIADKLPSGNLLGASGRVELYDDSVEGSALAGQLTITYPDGLLKHVISEELAMPHHKSATRLQGVAVGATGLPLIAITNASMQPAPIDIICGPEQGVAAHLAAIIPAEETILAVGCSSTLSALSDKVLSTLVASKGEPQAFSVEISTTNAEARIHAFALVPHLTSVGTTWTSQVFTDPGSYTSSKIIFAGVPMGTVPQLGGTYTPTVAVHNFAGVEQRVDVMLSATTSDSVVPSLVQTAVVQPGASLTLPLTGVGSPSSLQNTLTIAGSNSSGGIAAQMIFEDVSQNDVIQLLGKNDSDDTNFGMHPWSLQTDTDNLLLLFNETVESQTALIKIGNGVDLWENVFTLRPAETKQISLASLISQHALDRTGHSLSLGQGYGEFSWTASGPYRLRGRLLRVNKTTHTSASFQCAAYSVLCNAHIYGASSVTQGTSYGWSSSAQACINNYAENYCSGNPGGSANASEYSWSASGINLNGGTDQPSVSGTVSSTSAQLSVSISDYACAASASLNLNVTVPPPPPSINNINPTQVEQNDNGIITVNGSNLLANSQDTITASLSGTSVPFTVTGTPTANTASFTYDVSGLATGTYSFYVTNNEGSSEPVSFDVVPVPQAYAPPVDVCAVASSGSTQLGYTSIAPAGAPGGSGSVNVSFSGSVFNSVAANINYGPSSSPESIASYIAATISKNYYGMGLSAKAFGRNVIYSAKTSLGTVVNSASGGSFVINNSPSQASSAENACHNAPAPQTVAIAYAGYIPVDHAAGPDQCTFSTSSNQHVTVQLLYRGDGYRNSARVTQAISLNPNMSKATGYYAATGTTENYGFASPYNGLNANLSATDDDATYRNTINSTGSADCYLRNAIGKADPSSWTQTSTVNPSAATVTMHGESQNPLSFPIGSIKWNMTTETNFTAKTGHVTYLHTCYPSHQVRAGNTELYRYTPPSSDASYIVTCLTGVRDEISGTSPETSIK